MAVISAYPGANLDNSGPVYYGDGWRIVGGTTFWGVLSDSADSSYIMDDVSGSAANGHRLKTPVASTTIPANSAIKRITPYLRIAADQFRWPVTGYLRVYDKPGATGNLIYQSSEKIITPPKTGGFVTYALPSAPVALPGDTADPQYIVKHLTAFIGANFGLSSSFTGNTKVALYRIDIEYNEQPVASSLALIPSDGATRTTRPQISWTYTDPELDPQTAYRVVVWKQTDASNANCPKAAAATFKATDGTTRKAVVSTLHTVSGSSTVDVYGGDAQWQIPTDLPNGAYTAFVQVADTVGDRVRWSTAVGSLTWTQNVTQPGTPTISAVSWLPGPVWAAQINLTVPAYSHSPGTVATIRVERTVDNGVTWAQIPMDAATWTGQSSHTLTVYDTVCRANQPVKYRAMVTHDDGQYQYGSAYSATSAAVTPVIKQFVLRNVFDTTANALGVSIAGDLADSSDEDLGVFNPAGTVETRFVAGEVYLPKFDLTFTVKGDADAAELEALRGLQTILFLQTDMDGVAYWVRFDKTQQRTLLLSTLRKNAAKRPRMIQVPMWQCLPPYRADGTPVDA